MPTIEGEVERWFLKTYHNLKSLSGFEYQITITDFRSYFDTYPIPFQEYVVISVIKTIERKVDIYNKKVEKRKAESEKNNKLKK